MYCSNCGALLPPNGICAKCGVKATNMMFDGHIQGQPVVPQQSFYNPNPMYVQYQGPQSGYGQPYVPQENVAIGGIKDPRLVAGIGVVIKEGCGSMMTVIAALLTTVAMIFSFIQVFYISSNASYDDAGGTVMAGLITFFIHCIPFVLFAIGMWMITFHGFGTYHKSLYNDNACMHTSGFSTVQAGAIAALIPTAIVAVIYGFIALMSLLVGATVAFDFEVASAEDVVIMITAMLIIEAIFVVLVIMQSSIISQMAKIKHAIRGRNYESISILLPTLLYIMAAFEIICLVFLAIDGEIFGVIITGIYATCYAFIGCTLLYIRSKVNNYILRG